MTTQNLTQNLLQLQVDIASARKNVHTELARVWTLANEAVEALLDESSGFRGTAWIEKPGTDEARIIVNVCPHDNMQELRSDAERDARERRRQRLGWLLKEKTGYDFTQGKVYGPTDPYVRFLLGPFANK